MAIFVLFYPYTFRSSQLFPIWKLMLLAAINPSDLWMWFPAIWNGFTARMSTFICNCKDLALISCHAVYSVVCVHLITKVGSWRCCLDKYWIPNGIFVAISIATSIPLLYATTIIAIVLYGCTIFCYRPLKGLNKW